MSLEGKVAVVTGATKGVGRGVGSELARSGAEVFVTGR
jgi:NAD(P)-dependent dehydrogenase (short-subunit alcohol dehydrogenase family)